MRRTVWIVLFGALLLLGAAAPVHAEFNVSGSVSNQARVRLLQESMPEDYDWDVTMLLTTADFILRAADENRMGRLYADLDFRHDPTGIFADTNDLEWRLREAYGGFYSEYVSFEVGKIIYVWGLADEYNPTDLLNPDDLRWMFTFDKAQRKIGVYSANVTLSYGNFNWQTVVVPAFEPNRFPASDSQWQPWQLALIDDLIGAFPDYVDYQADQRPDLRVGNANLATRFRGTVGPVDFTAMYFDGYDTMPIYDIAINADATAFLAGQKPLRVAEKYQRYQAAGGGAAVTAGSFGFRTEGAYYTPKRYNTAIDESLLQVDNVLQGYQAIQGLVGNQWLTEAPSFSVVGGFDWRSGTMIYLNLQYVHQQILDYPDDIIYQQYEGMFTGKLQTRWLNDDLEAGCDGAYNVYHNDWYAKPYVAYNFTVDFRGEVGARLFGGDPETLFGEFDDNDFGYTYFRYAF